jgi:hypothetical protein
MPASTTQSPVGQAQRSKQRLPALLHTTLLLELEMKSSGICSVYSALCTVEDAVISDVNVCFAPRCSHLYFYGATLNAGRLIEKATPSREPAAMTSD